MLKTYTISILGHVGRLNVRSMTEYARLDGQIWFLIGKPLKPVGLICGRIVDNTDDVDGHIDGFLAKALAHKLDGQFVTTLATEVRYLIEVQVKGFCPAIGTHLHAVETRVLEVGSAEKLMCGQRKSRCQQRKGSRDRHFPKFTSKILVDAALNAHVFTLYRAALGAVFLDY